MRTMLKVVRLIDPEMCLDCRFAKVCTAELENGQNTRMIHCTRKDCDNWDYQSAQGVRSMEIEEGIV